MSLTTNSMDFSIPESNISFTGRRLSSDSGAILPLEFIRNNNLLDPLAQLPFDDDRHFFKNHNANFSLMEQYIFRLICGLPRQEDQHALARDPLLSRFFKQISSPASFCRLFDRVSDETTGALSQALTSLACRFVHLFNSLVVLDIDSTKTDTYGQQQFAAYIPHYGQTGYHPLLVTDYTTRLVLSAWLRPGNTFSSLGAQEVLENVLNQIPDFTLEDKQRKFMVRGDSAFYMKDLMTMLENRPNPVEYVFRAKNSQKLLDLCLMRYRSSDHKDDSFYTADNPYYGEIAYQISHSNRKRRVCFKLYFVRKNKSRKTKADLPPLTPEIFAVITNMPGWVPVKGVIGFYCQRGNSENFTKELKDDFYARILPHARFEENEFEFLLKAYAYNLFKMFQYRILEGQDCQMQMNSFRIKYQKVASRLSWHCRSWHLKIAASFSFGQIFMKYLHKVRTIACFDTG